MARKVSRKTESQEGKRKLSPDGVQTCRTCRYSHLCCWEMGNVRDPVIAKCTIRQYNNYDVADSPRRCNYYAYDAKWQDKNVEMKRKSTGWRGWCSVNKR